MRQDEQDSTDLSGYPALSQIQQDFEKPLDELKASFLQFQSDLNTKIKKLPSEKVHVAGPKRRSIGVEPHESYGTPKMSTSPVSKCNETLASLKEFHVQMKEKIPGRDPSSEDELSPESPSRDLSLAQLKQFQAKIAAKLAKGKSTAVAENATQATRSQSKALSSLVSPKVKKRLLPTQLRVVELERENKDMSRNALTASLLQFRKQLDGIENKGKEPVPSIDHSKATRHTSLELVSSAAPKRGSLDLKTVRKSPKYTNDLKTVLKPPKYTNVPQPDSEPDTDPEQECDSSANHKRSRRMSVEDRNFRKWFESKMEAREGIQDSERYILEEDDIEHDESGEDEPPESKSSPFPPKKMTAINETDDISVPRVLRKTDVSFLARKDREDELENMSRDDIKANLLQFQSQLNSRSQARKREQSADLLTVTQSVHTVSSHRWARNRISHLERQNEALSREELTASLLQFHSKIGQKISSPSVDTKGTSAQDVLVDQSEVGQDVGEAHGQDVLVDQSEEGQDAGEAHAQDVLVDQSEERQDAGEAYREQTRLFHGKLVKREIKMFHGDRAKLVEETETTPRSEMIQRLKQFQVEIQGRIGHVAAKKSVAREHSLGGLADSSTEENASKHIMVDVEGVDEDDTAVTDDDILAKMRQKNETATEADAEALGEQIRNSSVRKSKYPKKFEVMLRNLEELKKRNEEKVSTVQDLDRMRKQNEEKVSAMISALSLEEATELPAWFTEFARQQEDKFQELMLISEQRNMDIKRLNDGVSSDQICSLEHLETGEKIIRVSSDNHDQASPGCT
eukprot:scaffold3208_cov107-Cylindrotheca_fusiformis.AAC.7